MKIINCNGGKIFLWRGWTGWHWEIKKSQKFNPMRKIAGDYYMGYLGSNGFGHTAKLKDARRFAVRTLRV